MGGSQGAHAVNESVAESLPHLKEWRSSVQFLHLSGTADEPFMKESYAKNGMEATVMSFCNRMELAYSVADVVIGRSGAATLAEIAAFGLPSVLIPFPRAPGDHQRQNARVFERAGAAQVVEHIPGSDRAQRFGRILGEMLSNEGRRLQMAEWPGRWR